MRTLINDLEDIAKCTVYKAQCRKGVFSETFIYEILTYFSAE